MDTSRHHCCLSLHRCTPAHLVLPFFLGALIYHHLENSEIVLLFYFFILSTFNFYLFSFIEVFLIIVLCYIHAIWEHGDDA